MFDLKFTKLLVLAVIALIVFGPDRLPAWPRRRAGLRELRRMADGARRELQEQLGPEFSQFDINDLNPKRFVRKHLLDEIGDGAGSAALTRAAQRHKRDNADGRSPPAVTLPPGQSPPYDAEAT